MIITVQSPSRRAGGVVATDGTPAAFSFTDITDADLSTEYTSNEITITGINTTVDVTVSGGTYSKNGGGYTSSPGTCVVNDTFRVRVTSSGSNETAVNVTLTVGGVSDTYTVTTESALGFTPYANLPSGMTLRSDYGFSDTISSANDNTNPLGSSGWESTFNANAGNTRESDATAPESASFVYRAHWPAGVGGGGAGEQPGPIGFGLSGTNNRIYAGFWVKFDADFELHPISNKFVYVEPGNIIFEHAQFTDEFCVIPNQSATYVTNIVTDYSFPRDEWMHVEYYLNGVAGQRRVRIHVNGVRILDYTPTEDSSVNTLITGGWNVFYFDGTWGGSGSTKVRSSYRWIDHIRLYTASSGE